MVGVAVLGSVRWRLPVRPPPARPCSTGRGRGGGGAAGDRRGSDGDVGGVRVGHARSRSNQPSQRRDQPAARQDPLASLRRARCHSDRYPGGLCGLLCDQMDRVRYGETSLLFQPLHHQVHALACWRRVDGVAALRLEAVRGSQTDVDMLSRQVTVPAVDLQRQPVDTARLGRVRDHGRESPRQSPAYRCSRHGSP